MNRVTRSMLALFILLAAATAAWAQPAFPSKPVRLLIPFPPGGASDAAARIYGDVLAKRLGQPLVYDNRPGAGGTIAVQAALAAPADGHTLLWGVASMAGIPVLQKKPPFESMAELTPVATVARLQIGLFVHPDVPARSLEDLVRLARSKPDGLAYGTAALGEFSATQQLMKAAGISMIRVPYKGAAQAIPDLLSGRIQVFLTPLAPMVPHVQSGKIRVLAVLGSARDKTLPEVPTFAEAGYPSVAYPSWQAVFGPPRLPAELAERLARETVAVLQDPAVVAQLERLAIAPGGDTGPKFRDMIRAEEVSWRAFVKENAIEPE